MAVMWGRDGGDGARMTPRWCCNDGPPQQALCGSQEGESVAVAICGPAILVTMHDWQKCAGLRAQSDTAGHVEPKFLFAPQRGLSAAIALTCLLQKARSRQMCTSQARKQVEIASFAPRRCFVVQLSGVGCAVSTNRSPGEALGSKRCNVMPQG